MILLGLHQGILAALVNLHISIADSYAQMAKQVEIIVSDYTSSLGPLIIALAKERRAEVTMKAYT